MVGAPNYQFMQEAPGRYRISVMPIGDDGYILDGMYGQEIDVYKTPTPSAATYFISEGLIKYGFDLSFADNNPLSMTGSQFIGAIIANGQEITNGTLVQFTSILTGEVSTLIVSPSYIQEPSGYFALLDQIYQLTPGLYNVRLKNLGNDSAEATYLMISSNFTDNIEMIIAEKPVNVVVENGILSWNPVAVNSNDYDVVEYLVNINGQEYQTTETSMDFNIGSLDSATYNIGVKGVYFVTVSTLGNDTKYLTSQATHQLRIEVLGYPNEGSLVLDAISVSDGNLTWQSNNSAVSYELTLVGDSDGIRGLTIVIPNIQPIDFVNSYVVYEVPEKVTVDGVTKDIIDGTYLVKVRVIGDGTNYLTSNYSPSYSFTRLGQVTGLSNEIGSLVWTVKEDAYYYQLHVLGLDDNNMVDRVINIYTNELSNEQYGVTNARIDLEKNLVVFKLSDDNDFIGGNYRFYVRAVGNDTNTITSWYGSSIEAMKLNAPESVTISNGKIRWTQVPYAVNGYYLIIDGQVWEEILLTNEAEIPESYVGNPTKTFTISIQAVGNTYSEEIGVRHLDGVKSEVIDHARKLINVTNFKIIEGKLTWTAVEDASSYKIIVPDRVGETITDSYREITLASTVTSYALDDFSSGLYRYIKIKAIGGSVWLNGNAIMLERVVKVNAPNVNFIYADEELEFIKQPYTTYHMQQDGTYTTGSPFVSKYEIKVVNTETGAEPTIMVASFSDVESLERLAYEFVFTNFGSGVIHVFIKAIAQTEGDGNCYSLNSNYTANPIVIEIPDVPSNLRFDSTRCVFTWDAVAGSSITYTAYYKYQGDSSAIYESQSNIATNEFRPSKLGRYWLIVRADSAGQLFSQYVGYDKSANSDVIISAVGDAELYEAITTYGCQGTHYLFNAGEGTELSPYQIFTYGQLMSIKYYPNAHFELKNNIDFTNIPFEPIGTEEDPFTGSFSGRSKNSSNIMIQYYIREITYTNASNSATGLFGYTNGASISYVSLSGVTLSASPTTSAGAIIGGIVGKAEATSVYNCTVGSDCTIEFETQSGSEPIYYVGGIVGYGYNTVIYNSVNNGSIAQAFCDNIANNSYIYNVNAGGIAGYINGTIYRCINFGAVSGTNYVGGIVGQSTFYSETISCLYECRNSGNVTGVASGKSGSRKITYVGGIVGSNYVNVSQTYTQLLVENCYNTGTLSGRANSNGTVYIGGFAGYSNSKLNGFFNTGILTKIGTTGIAYMGGIVGKTDAASMSNLNSDGNSRTCVVIYHAYFDTNTASLPAVENSIQTSLINDEDWLNGDYPVGAVKAQISNYLRNMPNSMYVLGNDFICLNFESALLS